MRTKFSAPLIVFVLALSFAARADQDDIDNNADLQPTPEERARMAVLRRWPNATDIDALDMSDDDDDAPADDAGKPDMDKPDTDKADANKADVDKADAPDPADAMGKGADVAVDDDADDVDDPANWSVSVLFVSGGKHFEALCDDDGKIQYVYETVELPGIPKEIGAAAKAAVKGAEINFCQKVSDESELPIVHLWLVTVGEKNVLLDTEGKVLNVRDVPADPDDDAAPQNDDDDKLRI